MVALYRTASNAGYCNVILFCCGTKSCISRNGQKSTVIPVVQSFKVLRTVWISSTDRLAGSFGSWHLRHRPGVWKRSSEKTAPTLKPHSDLAVNLLGWSFALTARLQSARRTECHLDLMFHMKAAERAHIGRVVKHRHRHKVDGQDTEQNIHASPMRVYSLVASLNPKP